MCPFIRSNTYEWAFLIEGAKYLIMGIFRQWLKEQEIERQISPPAIVRQYADPIQTRKKIQILKNITQSVVKGLTGLLDFGQMKTEVSHSGSQDELPPSSNTGSEWLRHLKSKPSSKLSSWSDEIDRSTWSDDEPESSLPSFAAPLSEPSSSPSSPSHLPFDKWSDPLSPDSDDNYADVAPHWEKQIFGHGCHELCKFIRKYVPEYNGEKPAESICGTEGCAYFLDGIVMKATTGKEEFELAKTLKGKDEIVPVIDAIAFGGAYFILMHKTATDFSDAMRNDIRKGGNAIHKYFDLLLKEGYDLEKHLSVEKFRNFWRIRRHADPWKPKITETAERLFSIVMEIYKKTGYLIHSDIHPSNVGMHHDKPYIFDLGYPHKPEDEASRSGSLWGSASSSRVRGADGSWDWPARWPNPSAFD